MCGRVLFKLTTCIIRASQNVWPTESIFNYCFATECKRVNSDICSAPKYGLAPCKTLWLFTSFHCCYEIFCPDNTHVIEVIRTEVGILVFISEETVSQSRLASGFLKWGFLCFGFCHDYDSVYCSCGEWFMSHLSHHSWCNNPSPLPLCVKQKSHKTKIQWTLELRTVWCSNNLKFEQKIRGKSGFETRTKTRKPNRESRSRHVIAFSLCLGARAVARSVLPWLVQWASRKFNLFLSVLFISLVYFYINLKVEPSPGMDCVLCFSSIAIKYWRAVIVPVAFTVVKFAAFALRDEQRLREKEVTSLIRRMFGPH
jgi:hypothetical protein